MESGTAIEQLAAWVAGLTSDAVPEAQHGLARLRMLDTLGLIAVGRAQAAGSSMARWSAATAGQAGSGGEATNLSTGQRCVPATAALVHGTLAHARDFDDTFPDAVVHPGSTVVSAALAVAEATGASVEQASTAVAAGYEVLARLGRPAGRGFHARGFHATSVLGPVGAAATAGLLLGLDATQLADAMALSTSMGGGLMAFLADGGWSKWLHTGWSAHGGVVAAEIAANGFAGPRHALEHAGGLYGAFLGRVPALDDLSEGLGETWAGEGAQFKLYPCAHVIHPYIDGALGIAAARRFGASDVAEIRCRLAPWAVAIVAEPREPKLAPRNDLEAIASLPFMVAAGIEDGRVDVATLAPTSLQREDVRALARRIVCEADPGLGQGFDGSLAWRTLAGERIVVPVGLAPFEPERVRAKFRANAAIGRMTRAAEVEALLLAGDGDVVELMRLAKLD